MLRGLQHLQYTTGRLIGKGGEGQVFDVNENPNQLAKIYNEQPDAEKASKLRYMASLQKPAILQFAAWPADVLVENGVTKGFVMKKLNGYVPLHMLFSPMDRKKLFPDKGYNFLVHVARNLATAFHQLHQEELIIGDINEGNILVNAQGMIAFIDCDSFQIKNGTHYYYCEVGVPRYTPPELLAQQSFTNIIRTVNTDTFSLAILIFQLLFLGRHPFAGVNRSKEDWDEEKAIRQHQFAYSLHNTHKKLSPALNSLDISYLTPGVIELFHQAFEQDSNRPTPASWVQQLDILTQKMVICPRSSLHTYPAMAGQCPWCAFKEQKGILFFLDNTPPSNTTIFGDIQYFINGYQPEKLVFTPLTTTYSVPAGSSVPIEKDWLQYRKWHLYTFIAAFIVTPFFSIFNNTLLLVFIWAVLLLVYYHLSPWRNQLLKEKTRRYLQLLAERNRLEELVKMHNHPAGVNNYHKVTQQLESSIAAFRGIPQLFQDKKKELEEQLYNKQLLFFLCAFEIKDYTIPGFGSAKKLLLYNNNIRNAADISQLHSIKINGIGPKNLQLLFDWQRQMSADFTYRPNYDLLNKESLLLAKSIDKEKARLESTIKQQYQQLQTIKAGITTKQKQIEAQYNRLVTQVIAADVNYHTFKQLI
ncbi:protein kinase and helix-hairpin-helix DNA-binding domain-containing protein [Filimonas lacunae]|uniref:Protein kinase and helix-hairpin-helix DNA-binding domain-containing protein n=1 Tax=Filimonas lacunae TaxID=477680 RepID=A0A173MMA4_9BACT|nr:protein kinase [Filimonas lacunae]BAV08754.1 chaperonin [Filimonas lacunae]SIS61173.1 protein kinase and helix-hairpin-helix DNA-binding domain-containing protein [Filimonas lacunae]